MASTGVPLDAILRGYRVAALVIWQQVIEAVRIHPEIEAQSVLNAAAPLFDYLDAISVAVSNSYLETRERVRREQDRQYDQFFNDVLGGTADQDMVARVAEGGTVLEFPYRLVVVGADDASAEATIATAWMVVGAHVALYQACVVALVPASVRITTLRRLLQVAVGAERPPWQIAHGPTATRLAEVPAAVRATRDALTVGQILTPEDQVYDTAKLHPYLAWVHDLPGLRDFVEAALGPLLEQERSRSLPLRETLETVLSHSGLSAASRALGVHRHTLLYRMERLEDLVGRWDLAEDRLRLELALRGWRLLDTLQPESPSGPTSPTGRRSRG
jgi:sugar diacid utilization regulator